MRGCRFADQDCYQYLRVLCVYGGRCGADWRADLGVARGDTIGGVLGLRQCLRLLHNNPAHLHPLQVVPLAISSQDPGRQVLHRRRGPPVAQVHRAGKQKLPGPVRQGHEGGRVLLQGAVPTAVVVLCRGRADDPLLVRLQQLQDRVIINRYRIYYMMVESLAILGFYFFGLYFGRLTARNKLLKMRI